MEPTAPEVHPEVDEVNSDSGNRDPEADEESGSGSVVSDREIPSPPLRRSTRQRRPPRWLHPAAYDLSHQAYPSRVAQRVSMLKEVVRALLEDT